MFESSKRPACLGSPDGPDALGSAGLVIWTMEPATGRLLEVGGGARELLGAGRDQLLDGTVTLDRVLGPRGREQLAQACRDALAGETGRFEADLPLRNVPTRWTLRQEEGLVKGVVQDLTETRELQGQLFHSERLGTVGAFLGSVTHDFNNILISLMGYTELLLMDPDLGLLQRSRLEVMRRVAGRGQLLARRLLNFANKGGSNRKPTDLNELASEVLALLGGSRTPGLRCRAELDLDLPRTAVEPSEMHQVIMNLCVNARDAMPRGGELTVRTRFLRPDQTLLLEVQDTGGGIPAGMREKIFDPFFTTKGEGKGTGLGLAVVRRIVTAHGGEVQCSSREGEGSVFRVFLPLVREALSA